MKTTINNLLLQSYEIALEQQKNGWESDDAPNLLIDGLDEDDMNKVTVAVRAFAEAHNVCVVEFDEWDFDVMRVQSRALYREIQEATAPTIFLIKHYGVATGDAREFVRSIVKNKLYPVTNLWQETVLDRLLFTVALADKENAWRRNADIGESSSLALYHIGN